MYCYNVNLLLLLLLIIININGKLIKRNIDVINNLFKKNLLNIISISTSVCTINSKISIAETKLPSAIILNDDQYKKSLFNIPPTELIYPNWILGDWESNYKFDGAGFTDKLDFKILSKDVNIAGFRKYSVAFMPDIGQDFNTKMRFINRNNKVVEDLQYNLISIIETQQKNVNCKVHDFVYDPTNNPNRLGFKYDDNKGNGQIEIFINDRKNTLKDNYYKSITTLRQSSVRRREDLLSSNGGLKYAASQVLCYYAIETTLNYNKNDDQIDGIFRIFSYLQPQDSLYFILPDRPVSFFQYKINMIRNI